MRYAVFADIHGNLEALEAVLAALDQEGVDQYLCCGDIIGYGANPGECLQRLQEKKATCVAGNHDWATTGRQDVERFNPWARAAVIWTQSQLAKADQKFLDDLPLSFENSHLIMVHGTLHEPESFYYMNSLVDAGMTFRILDRPVCFVGHNHIPAIIAQDVTDKISYTLGYSVQRQASGRFIVNVGSVGQPRDGSPEAAYCIYDTRAGTIEIKRVVYDVPKTQMKIIQAGLPVQLANRLAIGL